MRKSTRALVGMVAIDLMLGLGALWMIAKTQTGEWHSRDPDAAISTISSVAGGAIGVVTVILALTWWRYSRSGY